MRIAAFLFPSVVVVGAAGCTEQVLLGGVMETAPDDAASHAPDVAVGVTTTLADTGAMRPLTDATTRGAETDATTILVDGGTTTTLGDTGTTTDPTDTGATTTLSDAGAADAWVGPGDGLTGCGPDHESCSVSLLVEGGTFFRTYSNLGDGAVGEADPATISDFRLDKYDVTVGRFRKFVEATVAPEGGMLWLPPEGSGKHTHLNGGLGLVDTSPSASYWPPPWGNGADAGPMYEPGWRGEAEFNRQVAPTDANLGTTQINPLGTWTPAPGPNESLPITAIDWYEAYAFCIWDGGFLPTQAEWEYAAAGGADQREYPWGDTDPGQQNLYAIYDFCWYEGACGTPPPANLPKTFAPVGSAPLGAGRWGQLDLAGNVDKWFLDTSEGPIVTPCVDCALVTGYYQQYRQFSGGWYNEPSSHLWSSSSMNYSAWYPPARYVAGVRCARVP